MVDLFEFTSCSTDELLIKKDENGEGRMRRRIYEKCSKWYYLKKKQKTKSICNYIDDKQLIMNTFFRFRFRFRFR